MFSRCWRPAGIVLAVLATLGRAATGADWPQTRAERSTYAETSTLADVREFLDQLVAQGAPIVVRPIGTSAGGRPIVAAIVARPGVTDGKAARDQGKLVVYLQANIHGGEVEGKEAVQMLLRDVASDRDGAGRWLDRLVLVVVPVFNVDGNETLGDGARIRPSQDGPARVGQRPNGAGLDLNRDAIKIQAPETRAVVEQVYRSWDPALMLDLHTTNGTRHGFQLTYSPPLNPNTDRALTGLLSQELLPSVRTSWRTRSGGDLFDYGNVENRPGARGWYTFGEEGRYVTNYVGLRNRLAILSEAASFLPFQTRVETTLGFVRAILEQTHERAAAIRTLIDEADRRTIDWGTHPENAPALGVRFEFASRGVEPVPLEQLAAGQAVDHHKAPDPASLRIEKLPIYDHFRATRSARFPSAYVVPPGSEGLLGLLARHGIQVVRSTEPWKGTVDRFQILEAITRRQAFQGGTLTRLEGRFVAEPAELPTGTLLVPTAQPLGRLAFHLLEPEGLDGAAAWGTLGSLTPPRLFPIAKIGGPLRVRTEPLP
ncbi:MAG: M14 family zinc carboxypeptidase [Isosphaeraceae bacterium]